MPAKASSRSRSGNPQAAARRQGSGRVSRGRGGEAGGGRYTPPIPRTVKRSPRWYPFVLLGLLIAGVAAIVLNYLSVTPYSPNSGYIVGGIVAIFAAALMATRYR